MAEQLTRVAGRVAQTNDAPFFLMNLADIAAADVMYVDSAFGSTSLRDFLIFQNPDMTSETYDLYVDTSKMVITALGSASASGTSAVLGQAILGTMVLGTE